jgi:signal-transduction protein with cAMP-binding, CBS, and nucleotidyltransferase domain
MVNLDFVESVEVFKDLDDDQLTAVRDCCREAEYGRGEKIFGVKGAPVSLWAVIEGEVDLQQEPPENPTAQGDKIVTLSKTMTFGWSSLVPPFKYRLSAYCATRSCKVLKIDSQCLTRLFEQDAELGYMVMSKIVAVVGTRFYQLREEIIKHRGHDIINKW